MKTASAFLKFGRTIANTFESFANRVTSLSDRDCYAAICLILAAALMTTSAQPLLGVVVYRDSTPAFALDICHPLQSLNQSQSAAPLAAPATLGRLVAIGRESAHEFVFRPLMEFISDIGPPPPKPAA